MMKMVDIFLLALTNMRRRRLRSLLTVVGVVIGTICILLMISFGYGNYRQLTDRIKEDQSLRCIYIYRDLLEEGIKLDDEMIALMAGIPGVEQVNPQVILPATLHIGPYVARVDLIGTNEEMIENAYEKGRFAISDSQAPLVVLGSEVKNIFQLSENAKEQEISLKTEDLYLQQIKLCFAGEPVSEEEPTLSRTYFGTVTGILKASGSEYSSGRDNAVYVDLEYLKGIIKENRTLVRQLNIDPAQYPVVILKAKTIDDVGSILTHLQNCGIQGSSPIEFIQTLQNEQKNQQWQLFAIGSVALLVASIGIANTMLANLFEQQKEIAILKVIGMRAREVRLLALCEAGILGLIGGLIGVFASYIIEWILSSGLLHIAWLEIQGTALHIPLGLSVLALLFTTGIGILAGLYPACKTAKMSVLDVLR